VGERIPTLQETINHCLELNLGINIEIKPNSDEERETVSKILSIVNKDRKRLWSTLLFSSSNLICMEELLKLAPEWPRGLLIENLDSNWEYYAKNSNVIH
jgi:glycerophosphoryl diester phosphodiesterase